MAQGKLFVTSAGSALSIAPGDGWVTVDNTAFSGLTTSMGASEDVSNPTPGILRYDGGDDTTVLVIGTASVYCSDSAVGFEFAIGQNTTSVVDSRANMTLTAVAGYRMATVHTTLDVSTSDTIKMMVQSGASTTLYLEDLSLLVFDSSALSDTEVFTGTTAPVRKP